MSNIYQKLTPKEFSMARCGQDGFNDPHRFLVHEFPSEDEYYRFSVGLCLDGALINIDRRMWIEPACYVPVEERRRYEVEWCIRELQKALANKCGVKLRPELLATINDLPEFDPHFSTRYEVWVTP